jgi:nitrogen-specific signal transduction histidine kinase
MEQKQVEGSTGEMMILGWIDHADRLGKSAQSTQHALTEQIQELAQLQQWTVNAALDLQKRTDAAIQKLEAERQQLQGTWAGLERNAVQAIQNAVRQQTSEIERQVVQALADPSREAAAARERLPDSTSLNTSTRFRSCSLILIQPILRN